MIYYGKSRRWKKFQLCHITERVVDGKGSNCDVLQIESQMKGLPSTTCYEMR
jgi:hypothetical protein